jgi:hypothetical protein
MSFYNNITNPQISYDGRFFPMTPATTGPVCMPMVIFNVLPTGSSGSRHHTKMYYKILVFWLEVYALILRATSAIVLQWPSTLAGKPPAMIKVCPVVLIGRSPFFLEQKESISARVTDERVFGDSIGY